MSLRTIVDISGDALEALTVELAAGGERAAAVGRALDRVPVAAFSIGLATPAARVRDRTVLVSFLLAATRTSRVVVAVDPAGQHPVNLARTVSTLSAVHGRRIGLAAWADASTSGWFRSEEEVGSPAPVASHYLRLLSSLWDSWPMDAMVRDVPAGHFVDAARIVRVVDPAYPRIGGPLTLPTDEAAKPPLLLVHRKGVAVSDGDSVDLQLVPVAGENLLFAGRDVRLVLGAAGLDAVLAWNGPGFAGPVRAALGLGDSLPAAEGAEPVFADPAAALHVG